MEKLNINAITSKIDSYGFSNTLDHRKITIGDTVIGFSKSLSKPNAFAFYEENTVKGEITYVYGDEERGFTKEIYNRKDTKIEYIVYNGNGIVKCIYNMYSEKRLKENPKAIEFLVGKAYVYDDSGTIIKTIDYNEIFKFSYENVKELLLKIDPKSTIKILTGMEYPEGPIWTVNYFSPVFKSCKIMIDASDGKIISDIHNIQSLDN